MPTALHETSYSYAEYLRLEEFSNVKLEFLGGQIYAMSGGTPEHAALAMSIGFSLIRQLRGGPCHVYSSDLRVRTPSGLSTYPDVSVICGPIERDKDDSSTLMNPIILVEVLSPGTEKWDRGAKFEHYKSLPSLQQCVLVSQRERLVEIRSRGEGGQWTSATFREGDVAELVINARLDVNEVYGIAGLP